MGITVAALIVTSFAADADYSKSVAYGQTFKSRIQFLDKGLKDHKIQLASAFASDGMSKYVTFFTDDDIVASAAPKPTKRCANSPRMT